MKKLFIILMFITISGNCIAQSEDIKSALIQVNSTLKNYAIGTMDFYPGYFSMAEGAHYSIKKFSIDNSNLVFDYKIDYPTGHASFLSEGVYKVTIPINAVISYPVITEGTVPGNRYENRSGISFNYDEGITKCKNGVSTLLPHFEIYGDSELTIKKFYKEIIALQTFIQREAFRGKLDPSTTNQKTPRSSTNTIKKNPSIKKAPESSNSSTKPQKAGRYVQ